MDRVGTHCYCLPRSMQTILFKIKMAFKCGICWETKLGMKWEVRENELMDWWGVDPWIYTQGKGV
jgi:hypothetical protein